MANTNRFRKQVGGNYDTSMLSSSLFGTSGSLTKVTVSTSSSSSSLAEKLSLFMKNDGDVTFIVGENKVEIKGSSQILSAVSSVFKVMFSKQWKEKSKSVSLPDIYSKVFEIFLKLLVTDDLKTSNIQNLKLSMEEILHLFYIAKKYDAASIEKCSREIIKASMTIQNAASIFEALEFLDEAALQQEVLSLIEKNANQVFKTKEFLETSRDCLIKVLKSGRLQIEEIDVFRAVYKWAKTELAKKGEEVSGRKIRKCLGDVIKLIRFPVIPPQDLSLEVGPTGMLTDTELLRLYEYHSLPIDKRSSKLKEIQFNITPRAGVNLVALEPSPKRARLDEKFRLNHVQLDEQIRLNHERLAKLQDLMRSRIFPLPLQRS